MGGDAHLHKLYGISKDRLDEIKQAFETFDVNGDEHITYDEVTTVFEKSGIELDEEEAHHFIEVGDTNDDQRLSWDEFLKLLARKMRITGSVTPELITELTNLSAEQFLNIQEAFQKFDSNTDGKVTYQEVTAIFQAAGLEMSEEDSKEFISSGDTDRNKVLTWEEFIVLLARDLKGKLKLCLDKVL